MGFDWRHYYHLAQDLVSTSEVAVDEEARHRAAISRAYYAAFISARNRLQEILRRTYDRHGVHQAVRDTLNRSFLPDWNSLGALLESMAALRNKADYDDVIRGDCSSLAATQLEQAFAAFELIAVLDGSCRSDAQDVEIS